MGRHGKTRTGSDIIAGKLLNFFNVGELREGALALQVLHGCKDAGYGNVGDGTVIVSGASSSPRSKHFLPLQMVPQLKSGPQPSGSGCC